MAVIFQPHNPIIPRNCECRPPQSGWGRSRRPTSQRWSRLVDRHIDVQPSLIRSPNADLERARRGDRMRHRSSKTPEPDPWSSIGCGEPMEANVIAPVTRGTGYGCHLRLPEMRRRNEANGEASIGVVATFRGVTRVKVRLT